MTTPDAPSTLLLDSPSLIYRAFFALPDSITNAAGQPVNAVRGYLDMVSHLLRTEHPTRIVHCFDADWRPEFRVRAFAGYKAQRLADDGENKEEEPDGLIPQFGIIDEILGATGMESAIAMGFEADDVIGTLAEQATSSHPAYIVTGDRDLFQLVRDGAAMVLYTVKGVRDLRRVDNADVMERYGVPASRYADFAILRGDPSDGLPGIPGVGPKRAATLINAYPNIDALLADAHSQPPRLRDALLEGTDYLRAMEVVVPVRRDAAVEISQGTLNRRRLDELAEEHNIAGPVERLLAALAA